MLKLSFLQDDSSSHDLGARLDLLRLMECGCLHSTTLTEFVADVGCQESCEDKIYTDSVAQRVAPNFVV